jgi:hypothetical protein
MLAPGSDVRAIAAPNWKYRSWWTSVYQRYKSVCSLAVLYSWPAACLWILSFIAGLYMWSASYLYYMKPASIHFALPVEPVGPCEE